MTGYEATVTALKKAPYSDAADEASIVMKGGITSGVVYPLAVCELAKRYRFVNVGGTSAGGIAAALTAAAEYARDEGGFGRLADLPGKLGNELSDMFQPSRSTAPLFELFRVARGKGGLLGRIAHVGWSLARNRPLATCTGALAVAMFAIWSAMLLRGTPHDGGDWVAIALRLWPVLPLMLAGAFAAAAVSTVRKAMKVLPGNGNGLCIGSNGARSAKGTPPFTDWLHAELRRVSGEDVLTFGDLESKNVTLEMMTTNVTQRRPIRLPFAEDTFYFCERDMARWFPPAVVEVLKARGLASHNGRALCCPHHEGVQLHCLPEPANFPVLVAVRMTLSFPGLISAVPLYFIDFGKQPSQPVTRAWFSDGGISSNFPIHFFDTLLPARPTFAISLGPYPGKPVREDDVYYRDPTQFPSRKAIASDSVGAFAAGILDTMQNWSDLGQSRIEGFRDRIVEVRQRPDEGGLNLDMPRDTIISLAMRGHRAAVELMDRFQRERHLLKRYDTAMARLQSELTEMAGVFDASYRNLVVTKRGLPKADATDALLAFGRRGIPPSPNFETKEPRPLPDLRIVARY